IPPVSPENHRTYRRHALTDPFSYFLLPPCGVSFQVSERTVACKSRGQDQTAQTSLIGHTFVVEPDIGYSRYITFSGYTPTKYPRLGTTLPLALYSAQPS